MMNFSVGISKLEEALLYVKHCIDKAKTFNDALVESSDLLDSYCLADRTLAALESLKLDAMTILTDVIDNLDFPTYLEEIDGEIDNLIKTKKLLEDETNDIEY